ncbi:MAG TPA: 16S rRNA (adenine(1518)-N(6)/adenine(1519)-N(6))-dimethyltransferase RsmA [Candidatus Deferrimicrobiaceae bacterium]|nr:16S rRNA (adenine(1518)-N(6)/adenine(1519)-N(6))-dimethyltransferase RsmA [Candidatus Deferrimicrobiaceae bacterium]
MPRRDFPAERGTEHPSRLLSRLGLSPRKKLGQNFLHDRNVAEKIVSLALSMGTPYLEIGPGLGALTDLLAEERQKTVAVEVDRGFAAYLRNRYEGSTVEVVEADFLGLPEEEWKSRFPDGGTVVGNLPYSVSSPILLRLMELRRIFPRAVLMLQKEVVERLCAPPGGKKYGILSVYLAVLSGIREEFTVRRTCFTPSPDVDSAVVSVRFRSGVSDETFLRLQAVVRAAFAQRRKTLRNAPVPFLPGGTQAWCGLLAEAGIDPSSRAETVPPDRFLRLARLAGPEL